MRDHERVTSLVHEKEKEKDRKIFNSWRGRTLLCIVRPEWSLRNGIFSFVLPLGGLHIRLGNNRQAASQVLQKRVS